jgi:4-hydroxy 2-oxovalerate aldolase
LPAEVRESLAGKELLDFGISVQAGHFYFAEQHCTLPTSLVAAYALAIAASGRASRVLLAGFDGYAADDPRSVEVNQLLEAFQLLPAVPALLAVTPSRYKIPLGSIYAL